MAGALWKTARNAASLGSNASSASSGGRRRSKPPTESPSPPVVRGPGCLRRDSVPRPGGWPRPMHRGLTWRPDWLDSPIPRASACRYGAGSGYRSPIAQLAERAAVNR